MATTNASKLNKLYTRLAPGTPLTRKDLANLGISADLTVHYVRAGWLKRLARGVYHRPNDPPTLHPSLVVLQRQLEGLHVGGKSALDWHGIRQYVSPRPVLHLYGWNAAQLPSWFTQRFPAEYRRKRLFKERLEVLSEVGVRQPLEEARELTESSYNLRADVLRELLERCTSVKTVRLCLQLGREQSQRWALKLDPARLPTGSKRPWVSRSSAGLLVLKP